MTASIIMQIIKDCVSDLAEIEKIVLLLAGMVKRYVQVALMRIVKQAMRLTTVKLLVIVVAVKNSKMVVISMRVLVVALVK